MRRKYVFYTTHSAGQQLAHGKEISPNVEDETIVIQEYNQLPVFSAKKGQVKGPRSPKMHCTSRSANLNCG